MFYCKDVKYDMCELKKRKKNHDKKNKICKEFDDLTFHPSHILFHQRFLFRCREGETSRTS